MTNFVFFTSNRTKLAHFKHIGSSLGLDILGFRERSFYASYHEPAIDDRFELLRQSYESALMQWQRRAESLDDIFFLEDTSVTIEALSSQQETPGVNVKYWMKGMTLSKLNRLIIDTDQDNRSAIVRSDIIAHIPLAIKRYYNLNQDFFWVYAEQKGKVIEKEIPFKTNLVFPWLDNRSFNKWFIPAGASAPIGSLPIDKADKYDFRRQAFEKLVSLFEQYRILERKRPSRQSSQLLLPLTSRPTVYVICGYSCAGKSTLATWISREYSVAHLEASDFMYKEFWQRHGVASKYMIGDFAESALVQTPDIVASSIAKLLAESLFTTTVVTGFRSPQEIETLARLLPDFEIRTYFVDAPYEIRLQRALQRDPNRASSKKLLQRDAQEERMGIKNILHAPQTCILQNHTSLRAYFDAFDRELARDNQVQRHRKEGNKFIKLGPLEEAIIRSLASRDARAFGTSSNWLTTTQIANAISEDLGVVKSKNNVSRYFNQSFYPYYELEYRDRRLLCRLSNTGVGVAHLIGPYSTAMRKQQKPIEHRIRQIKTSLFD